MKKDKLDRFLIQSGKMDISPPNFDEVIGYRPRRRKVRRTPLVIGAILIAAGSIIFALPGISPDEAPELAGVPIDIPMDMLGDLLGDMPMELTVVYFTDWLAEPPGYEWISQTPEFSINTGDYYADL